VKRNIKGLILLMAISLSLVACSSNETKTTATDTGKTDKLKIFTTIYPFQYFTERIGGDYVTTENIVPPGSDAHSVEVTQRKMVEVAESDAFIHSGTGLESYADSVANAMEGEKVKIVNATNNVNLLGSEEVHKEEEEEHHDEHQKEETRDSHHEHGEDMDVDPHIWLDPIRSIKVAENIKNALIELSPENKEQFEENFTLLKSDLEKLDAEFKEMVAASKTKTFIVSHSAYGYWEDTYGLEQVGINGLSPTDDPSQSQLVEIINLVKENNLKHIFFESNLTSKVALTVKKETNTNSLTLHNLESITDEDVKENKDYFILMRENIKALKQGLN